MAKSTRRARKAVPAATSKPASKPATPQADVATQVADAVVEAGTAIDTATTATVVPEPTLAETQAMQLWSKVGVVAVREGRKQPIFHIVAPKTHDAYCGNPATAETDAFEIKTKTPVTRVCADCQSAAWEAGWRRGATAIATAINRTLGLAVPEAAVTETAVA